MTDDRGRALLSLARAAIATRSGNSPRGIAFDAPWLRAPGATFVALTLDGKPRGNAGSLEPLRPLAEDIAANAEAAAFHDPCFPPLPQAALASVLIEVTLLSPLEILDARDEASLLARLRPGIDGVVFEYGRHRSSFLPEAWQQYGNPADFLHHLKYRAGLPPDFWHAGARISRFTAIRWRETGHD